MLYASPGDRSESQRPVETRIIVQARMGSTRFPGKVLADLHGHPVIWHVYTRCASAFPTVVAIPDTSENDPLSDYLTGIEAPVFRWDGPENDVLGRYADCVRAYPCEWVVRVTGDCPLVERAVIRGLATQAIMTGAMYVSNIYPERAVPSGFDVEVMHSATVRWAADYPEGSREHVTTFIRETFTAHGAKQRMVYPLIQPDWLPGCAPPPPPPRHLSVDTPADLDRIRALTADR